MQLGRDIIRRQIEAVARQDARIRSDVPTTFSYNAAPDDPEAHRLIADLEDADGAESTYRPAVEALVADLMERTFKSTEQAKQVRLAALELRARLILKR